MRRALVLVPLLLGVALALPAGADEGPWAWPLAGAAEVSRAFAPPAQRYGSGHRGVDLAAAPGAAVRAAGAGRVTYAGPLAGRGVVVVSHGLLRTTYEPVAGAVTVGQQVERGQLLGRLESGHLGCPAAACLHWGLRRGEDYLDPVRLLRRGPVRLLPAEAVPADAVPAEAVPADAVPADAVPAAARPDLAVPPSVGSAADGGADAARARAPEPVPEVAEPSWSLRAGEAPLGAVALVALVVGIGLLVRPRPLPPGPVSGGLAVVAPSGRDEPVLPPAPLLDLDEARARRRAVS